MSNLAINRLFICLMLIATITSCASELPRERSVSKALAVEKVDLSLIDFADAISGKSINLKEYMYGNNLEFLLLMFGSVGCAKCNEKAKLLSTDYIPSHPLFLTKSDKRFDMVGVNTDTGAAMTRFRGIMLNETSRKDRGYDFVKWSDPSGKTMMKFLVANGDRFGVPFTILLTKSGIVWRYNNQQSYEVPEMLERTLATIEGREQNEVKVKPRSNPAAKPIDPGQFNLLSFVTPSRFDRVKVSNCASQESLLPAELNDEDVKIIQVTKGSCYAGGSCFNNIPRLRELLANCRTQAGRSCGLYSLELSPSPSLCEDTSIKSLAGGQDFFDVFTTHFNWASTPIEDENGAPSSIPEINEPMIFAFKRDGSLVYSFNGLLPNSSDPSAPDAYFLSTMSSQSAGIDLPVWGKNGSNSFATQSLRDLRSRAKYTVMATFDPSCGSCVDELENWSKPNHLLDYCAESSGYCQLYGIEGSLARPNTQQGRIDLFEAIESELGPRNVRVPILLDPTALVFSGGDYSKLFESYFLLLFPSWGGMYGTVIYDREGKIIAQLPPASEVHAVDPVLETLKSLRNLP